MDFPQLDSTYEDEFGTIDREVYLVGSELWGKQAEYFAQNTLNDVSEGCRLMMKAIADVSEYRREHPSEIDDLSGYLFTSFKHLVFAKLKQDGNRRDILDNRLQNVEDSEEIKITRKIAVEEILQKLSAQDRKIFVWRYLYGFSSKEIARELGMKENVLRSRMSKFRRKIKEELEGK